MRIVSNKDSNKEYIVKRDRSNNMLTCNCPAWIFNKSKEGYRRCRHIVEAEILIRMRDSSEIKI